MKTFLIKAKEHTPQIIKCSLNDHFVFSTPVPVVFFYRETIAYDLIIESFQRALEDFPVFAGILIKKSHQLYIDCNNQGVQIKICNFDTSLSFKLSEISRIKKSTFVDLINPSQVIKKRRCLLTIKVSYYSDGMAIGYCWHHSVGDMATFMEFLKTASSYARGSSCPKPIIVTDREHYLNQCINSQYQEKKIDGLKYLTLKDIFHFMKYVFSRKRKVYLYFNKEEIEQLRNALSHKVGQKLSRNDVLCAHLLSLIAHYRKDNSKKQNTTIVVNIRPRIGMLKNVLGNYLGIISLRFTKSNKIEMIAKDIHSAVDNFLYDSFRPFGAQEFIQQYGNLKKINRVIPLSFLPQHKNLIISNWSNFGVYTVDFGVAAPHFFLPIAESPLPWVACIVEGFDNSGLLATIVLPSKIVKKLKSLFKRPKSLSSIKTVSNTVGMIGKFL